MKLGEWVMKFFVVTAIMASWLAFNYALFFGSLVIAADMRELAMRALGTLDMSLGLAITHVLGSTIGSARQRELLAQSTPPEK